MSVYVFLGPTLTVAEARAELDATYLPPVSQGDVYRVARLKPRAIGIIDGYFQRVPAVWHKEILWAMEQGIHVFGSASMGALRASELASFGMEGVGAVFEAYRSGALTDDDEVAVTHAPAESGFVPQSEAMVNIRATFAAAEADAVVSPDTRRTLERIAKDRFYPDRNYPLVLRRAIEIGAPEAEIDAFRAWLPDGRVDVKRADAMEMLRRMRAFVATEPGLKQTVFRMEPTLQWQRVTRFSGTASMGVDGSAGAIALGALLDEIGLEGDLYPDAYQATLLSYLALREAKSRGYESRAAEVEYMGAYFLQSRGLQGPADSENWLLENHITRQQLDALMSEEVVRGRIFEELEVEIVSRLPNHLRLLGAYSRLLARAQAKQRVLEKRGLEHAGIDETGLSVDALLQWYFARRRHPVPDDVDSYARSHGFGTKDAFLLAVAREHFYVETLEPDPPGSSRFEDMARAMLANLQQTGQAASPGDRVEDAGEPA